MVPVCLRNQLDDPRPTCSRPSVREALTFKLGAMEETVYCRCIRRAVNCISHSYVFGCSLFIDAVNNSKNIASNNEIIVMS